MKKTTIRYSEAFKRQVVEELERVELPNMTSAREKYGIKGRCTVRNWIKKYGKEHLLPRQVRIEMPDEQREVKKLKKRIRELEAALVDSKVKEVLNQAYFDLICEDFGVANPDEYKKKAAAKLSDEEK
ncbi:MAG: transposase [Proteobacteria bacterium]|nr:transposase [Pseudomonadota bacterium]